MNPRPVWLGTLLTMATTLCAQPPVRVACVGDSITFGDKLAQRETEAYPAVLQRLSQGRYLTGNFGVNGATALAGIPFRSWVDTPACREALAFAPGIAVVMLGINDLAFPDLRPRYAADLRAILARFQALPAAPRLFLCTLTPIAPAGQQAAVNREIREVMNPAIRAVAAESGATLIDLAAVYPNELELLPDGLHPSPAGAELIARTVLAALDAPAAAAPAIRSAPPSGPAEQSIRNEALAARARAERWLAGRPADAAPAADVTPPDLPALLPLLAGEIPPGIDDYFQACSRLADLLAEQGEETVFLAPDRPVAWRTALLHQLVQRQRIDPRGAGFWRNPGAAAEDAADARATRAALHALAAALGF